MLFQNINRMGVSPESKFEYSGTTTEGTQYKSGSFITDIWGDVKEAATDLYADLNVVQKLRDYATAFANKTYYWQTINTAGWSSTLVAQRNALLSTAQSIINQIDKTGLDYQKPDGMGILPVIGAAAAGAVITAIIAWFKASDNLDQRVAVFNAERERGATADQAIKITDAVAPRSSFMGSFGTAMGGTVGVAIMGAGLLWYLTRK